MQSRQVLWLCGLLAVSGCGEDFFDDTQLPDAEGEGEDDADEEDEPVQVRAESRSGVDGNHVVAELDGSEMNELCGWASASYSALLGEDLTRTCTLFAGGYGTTAEECSLLVDACVADLEVTGFVEESDGCAAAKSVLS